MSRSTRVQLRFSLFLIASLTLALLPASASATASPPRTTSVYGMDIFGLGWQWSFPRIDAYPRMSGSIRLDMLDSAIRQAAEAGVRWNRLTVWWCMVEPERGQWFWDDVDAAIQISRNYGIETVPTILYPPYWAVAGAPYAPECVNNSRKNYPPTNPADWENFVRTMVRRYGPAGKNVVRYWEIWNEPDLPEFLSMVNDPGDGTVQVYADLLKRATAIIRAESPGAQILIGGLSDIRGPEFLDKLLQLRGPLDVRGDFDVVSLHAYSNHSLKIRLIRDVLVKHGLQHLPLWDTELNFLGWSYEQAQVGLPGLYQLMQTLGVSRSFWYLGTTTRWGPGIFNERYPEWDPIPFTPSPFYPTFKAQAAPSRLPGKPIVLEPVGTLKSAQPRFQWQAPPTGVYPLAGYKLLVDNKLFLNAALFANPGLDVWVSDGFATYLPLATGGRGRDLIGANLSAGAVAAATRGHTPVAPLAWGAHYWRVAAVDVQGNVGPYSDPVAFFIRPAHSVYIPLP